MGGGGWSACLGTKDFSRPGGTQRQAAVGCRAAGAPFAFPAGPWPPAPVQLSSDFSCFLTALPSGGSPSHADLVSSVVLRPVLLWCDSRRPKSVPHRLLPDSLGGLHSGLLFTICSRGFALPRIPGYRSEASHLCLITTLTAAPQDTVRVPQPSGTFQNPLLITS